jgi:hypothetical protein
MTTPRAAVISAIASIATAASGRALMGADSMIGYAILFPGGIVEIFGVRGVHGSSHSKFLTELRLAGVSAFAWWIVVFLFLGFREIVLSLFKSKKRSS